MSLGFTFHMPGYFPAFSHLTLLPTVETGYIDTTVYPVFYKHITVEFKVPSQWGNCTFDIYRGDTNLGPWEKITPAPISGTFFKDSAQDEVSKYNDSWYIVECRLPDGRRIQGQPETWRPKRNNWVEIRAKEIERREILLLEKFTGQKSMLFKRRYFGLRCRNCWNATIEKVTKDHCQVCLGTSYEGGFFPGYETLFQYDPIQKDATLGYQGLTEPEQMVGWTISKPVIDAHDLLLRMNDFRLYRIERVSQTELQGQVVRQVVNLTELGKDSVEYNLTKQAMPAGYF